MKLATSTGDFLAYSENIEQSLKFLHDCGFRYVNFEFSKARVPEVFSDNWKDYAKRVKNAADQLGMEFVQSHAPMGSPFAEDNSEFIADNIRCIRFCKELGIDSTVVHCGFGGKMTKLDNFEKNKEFYSKLLPYAEECGVNILTENFIQMHHESGTYWPDSAQELLELIEYVNHPFFHACWDFGHANSTRIPPDESLRKLGKHVLAIHVHDNQGVEHPKYGYPDPHMAPLFGDVNWDSVMNGLLEIDYKGAFTLETAIVFGMPKYKKPYEKDTRINNARLPLDIKLQGEKLVYSIAKYILESYNCFEG